MCHCQKEPYNSTIVTKTHERVLISCHTHPSAPTPSHPTSPPPPTNTTNPSQPRGKHFTNPYLLNNVAAYRHRWRKPPHALWPHRKMKLCELVPGTCHVVRGTRTPSLCHLPKKKMLRDRIKPFCLMKVNWGELKICFFFSQLEFISRRNRVWTTSQESSRQKV